MRAESFEGQLHQAPMKPAARPTSEHRLDQRTRKPECPQSARHVDPIGSSEWLDANRFTNSSAFSATSRQPASIVSACPRPGILTISVTPLLLCCFLYAAFAIAQVPLSSVS